MRLIVFSGLSGAGKSATIADEFSGQDVQVIEYDFFRQRFPNASTGEVMQHLFKAAGYWLDLGWDIVVDAVNLHPHDRIRWEAVSWAFGAELEWRYIDTPLETCIARDSRRDDPVGREAIEKQYAEAQ